MLSRYTKVLFISFMLITTFTLQAQFETGKSHFGPSLGLSFLGSVPQIGTNYEYGIHVKDFGDIGVGGIFRYWSYSEVIWSYTNILIGAQGNYHFKLNNPKVDLWAGLVLAFDFGSISNKGTSNTFVVEPTHGGAWLALQGGGRYWISNTFAIGGRIGFGSLSYSSLELTADWKF